MRKKKSKNKSSKAFKAEKEKEAQLLSKRRKLQIALLTMSFYVYIDATGASPMYHIQKLINGLPTPGHKSRQKSKVIRK